MEHNLRLNEIAKMIISETDTFYFNPLHRNLLKGMYAQDIYNLRIKEERERELEQVREILIFPLF